MLSQIPEYLQNCRPRVTNPYSTPVPGLPNYRLVDLFVEPNIFEIPHPRVENKQEDDGLIYVDRLRYLAKSGRTGGKLLLDILEGGRASFNRCMLTIALNRALAAHKPGENLEDAGSPTTPLVIYPTTTPGFVPREQSVTTYRNPRALLDRAIWKGCDVDAIPIPNAMMWLDLDIVDRVLKFRSKEKELGPEEIRDYVDDMVSDRRRQEFRFIFLKYIQSCLLRGESVDFMDFYIIHYISRTETCKEESEKLARLLKNTLSDNDD
ncbi:hypothetical protein F4801DRAFT_575529 [Xylaria longipes]|nr:hypothetical protein F4801DRAFT_575529 [Xylaria longipes]RYC59692.1 hypothetical protein CHU98_g6518 [Xylaria longipes]